MTDIDPEIKKFINDAMHKQTKALEAIVQENQREWVNMQMQMNQRWNAINAIVRVLYQKDLITNEVLEQAGRDLMAEAKENIKRAKAAALVSTLPLTVKTPIEQAVDAVRKGVTKGEG